MRRRSILAFGLLILLLASLLAMPAAGAAPSRQPDLPSLEQVQALIQRFGPQVVLHPDDAYRPDSAEAVLDGPSQLAWGLVFNENSYPAFSQTVLGTVETSAATLLDDLALARADANAADPAFRTWLVVDESLRGGNLDRAQAYVRVRLESPVLLDLQFWFYYPYNGPVKGHAVIPGVLDQIFQPTTVGRHTGDWEQVTVRLTRSLSRGRWLLDSVFMSQHDGGQWYTPGDGQLGFMAGTMRPLVYAAKDSHAFYPQPGTIPFQHVLTMPTQYGSLNVELVDFVAAGGPTFAAWHPANYTVVSSDVAGQLVAEPDWLAYDGRWGPFEKLFYQVTIPGIDTFPFAEVGDGPVGPALHGAWVGAY